VIGTFDDPPHAGVRLGHARVRQARVVGVAAGQDRIQVPAVGF
jgi:hypothetical protein